MRITRSNTILYCSHWRRTVGFYRDVLGLSIHHETVWMVEFQLQEKTYLSIADAGRTTVRSADGDGITLSFRVEDLEHTHKLLAGQEIDTSEIRTVWGAHAIYLHDPEGHRIEFWSDTP